MHAKPLTAPRLEEGHGDFFTHLIRRDIPNDRLSDFEKCLETCCMAIESHSPAILIPGRNPKLTTFYGMQAPVGSVALLFVDGATHDKAGKPSWLLLIAAYGGWDADYRQELLARALPKEGDPAEYALLGVGQGTLR